MATSIDIVAKLWSLCHVLRDDGVTYNESVTELTFLLFLRMLEETKDQTDDLYKLPDQQVFFQRHSAFAGAELVPDTHRLCLMNLLLHGIEGGVELADTLSIRRSAPREAGGDLRAPISP
jgi:type I restriction-modification system DNA methylase subunit